jgi:hypothetical protein
MYRQKSTNALLTHDRAEFNVLRNHQEVYTLMHTPMFDAIVDQYLADEFTAEEHEVRYVRVVAETGYCGTDCDEFYLCVGVTDKMLDEDAEEMSRTNAEQYEYMIDRDDYEGEDEYQEALEQYYEDCNGWWEEVNPDDYDGVWTEWIDD